MKVINVKGIGILIAILLIFHLLFGFVISPFAGEFIIDKLNKSSDIKMSIGRVSLWPLTFSFSINDLKIFDPDNEEQKMIGVRSASIRISPVGLLCKRLVVSKIKVSGADIALKGESDGSFNVQKLGRSEEQKVEAGKKDWFGFLKGKKDWFSRIYEMIKKKSSKESIEKKAEEKKQAKKIVTEVTQLPRGRRVEFKSERSGYLLEVRKMVIKDASIHMEADNGQRADIKNGIIKIRGAAYDPEMGTKFDHFSIKGVLDKNGVTAGKISVLYNQKYKKEHLYTDINFIAEDIDLTAISFVYSSSLPVTINKGILDLKSRTSLVDDNLDSKNSLVLRDQNLSPGGGTKAALPLVPMPVLCEAINSIDPVKLDFDITGTTENPEFTNFQDSLMTIIKPYAGDIAENIQKKGLGAIKDFFKKEEGSAAGGAGSEESAGTKAQAAIDSIKALFDKDKAE